jgi:hypothetical protein
MIQPGNTPASATTETPAGLIVPASAVEQIGLDPDGRRRIVLTRENRKVLNRAIIALRAAGLGIVIGCRGTCGNALAREGEDGPDQGYGCACSRVHFR